MLFPFHVTRDADIAIKELEAEGIFLETIEEGVRQRRFGSVVRLGVTDDIAPDTLDILMSNLELEPAMVYRAGQPAFAQAADDRLSDRPARN